MLDSDRRRDCPVSRLRKAKSKVKRQRSKAKSTERAGLVPALHFASAMWPRGAQSGMILANRMPKARTVITLESRILRELDRRVHEGHFTNRSNAIQVALGEMLESRRRRRLAKALRKVSARKEQALAEQFLPVNQRGPNTAKCSRLKAESWPPTTHIAQRTTDVLPLLL